MDKKNSKLTKNDATFYAATNILAPGLFSEQQPSGGGDSLFDRLWDKLEARAKEKDKLRYKKEQAQVIKGMRMPWTPRLIRLTQYAVSDNPELDKKFHAWCKNGSSSHDLRDFPKTLSSDEEALLFSLSEALQNGKSASDDTISK